MNASKTVYPQGRVSVALTAGQILAVATQGVASVFQVVGFPNEPAMDSLQLTVNNGEGTFTPAGGVACTAIILAGAAPVQYSVGLAPRVLANAQAQTQGAPGVLNATGALTGAMILAGLVTSTTAAAVAGTVDTGTVMDTNIDMQIGDSFDFSIIATGANAFTLTAAAGVTIVGNAVVASAKSGQFRMRKTAAATYIIYRLDGG